MKVVYIAHPVGGNVKENLEKIRLIIRNINHLNEDILPFAHYWVECHALDDSIPTDRARGMKNNEELFKRGFIDELWLFGDKISKGMREEVELAHELGIPVIPQTFSTKQAYYFYDNHLFE